MAETIAVPLQLVRTFGKSDDDWRNMLIFGDNLPILSKLLEDKKAGKLCNADGTPGVGLIYIDLPSATKREFSGSQDQKAYQDKIAGAIFLEFLRKCKAHADWGYHHEEAQRLSRPNEDMQEKATSGCSSLASATSRA